MHALMCSVQQHNLSSVCFRLHPLLSSPTSTRAQQNNKRRCLPFWSVLHGPTIHLTATTICMHLVQAHAAPLQPPNQGLPSQPEMDDNWVMPRHHWIAPLLATYWLRLFSLMPYTCANRITCSSGPVLSGPPPAHVPGRAVVNSAAPPFANRLGYRINACDHEGQDRKSVV